MEHLWLCSHGAAWGWVFFFLLAFFFWIVCARECAMPTFVGTLWPRSFSWPKRVCPLAWSCHRWPQTLDGQYQSPDPLLQLQLWLWLWLLLLSTSRMYSFPKGITYVRSGHNKFLHWKCQLGRWFSLFLRWNFVIFCAFFLSRGEREKSNWLGGYLFSRKALWIDLFSVHPKKLLTIKYKNMIKSDLILD